MAQGQVGEILSYFDNDDEKGIARCTICKRNFKNNRTHNLKRHLVKAHQIEDTHLKKILVQLANDSSISQEKFNFYTAYKICCITIL